MATGFGIAVGVHVLLLLFVRPMVVDVRGNMGHAATAAEQAATAAAQAAAVPLEPSCDGEAMLRAAARAVWCATPFADEAGACLDAAAERLRIDEMLCHLDQMDVVPTVALSRPVPLEEVPQIDPEPLLADLTPEEQKQFEQKLQEMAPQPPPPPPPPPPPAQRPQNTQIVENTKTDDEDPENARFLAEYSQKVDKQTVARGDRQEDMIKKPDPAETPSKKDLQKAANQPEPSEDPPGKSDAPPTPGLFSMRRPGTPHQGDVSQDKKTRGAIGGSDAPVGDGSRGKKGDGSISQDERKPSTPDTGQGGGGGGKPRAPNLRPDEETLERIVGGGSVDDVEDVDEGDETAYNAKRWVYASFFNRMKRMVAQNWDPATVWMREDPEGEHYGFKDRITVLRVSLDTRGKVVKTLVVQASGVEALDDEAIRAFQAAMPFPNPPEALFDGDDQVTFDFGFHFEIGHESFTSWKLYRGQ